MKKSRLAMGVFCVLVLIVQYLIALNGRYKPFSDGFLILDNWTGKVYETDNLIVEIK